ncbi:MAG: FGGY family carbohydrate kinase [Firmicutes bacterium]|nr:FGGY family carbohydrate kinase [Bacillota bacterium]
MLLGLDIGTSGCKAVIYESDGRGAGRAVSGAYREYGVVADEKNGWFEIDPNAVWDAAAAVIREAAAAVRGDVSAVGVSSFGESAVPVDADGNVLANAILYTDPRGAEECALMEPYRDITKLRPHPMYTLPKILWIRKNRPELFEKTRRFLLFEDFTLFKLTGNCRISYSEASRTGCFDVAERRFAPRIFADLGLSPDIFSAPAQAGTPAGALLPGVAAELGLRADAIVSVGGQDQVCSAVGAGAVESGAAALGIGTVECITPVFGAPIADAAVLDCGYCCVPYAVGGKYVTYAYNYTGGALLRWFRDAIAPGGAVGKDVYQKFDARVKDRPTNLLLLPYFAGAATPFMDTAATGAIFGLKLTSTAEDIYRAILEGCCFEMLVNIERLAEAGVTIGGVTATGGGASETWLRMKADVFGFPVRSLENSEAGTMGAAIMAGAAAGVFGSVGEGVKKMVRCAGEFLPNPEARGYYMEKYEKYKKMYKAVREVMNEV